MRYFTRTLHASRQPRFNDNRGPGDSHQTVAGGRLPRTWFPAAPGRGITGPYVQMFWLAVRGAKVDAGCGVAVTGPRVTVVP